MSLTIEPARSDDDIQDVTRLAWAFVALLKDRYPERIAQIDEYLKRQRFEEMLADYSTYFMPPTGECMLARLDGMAVGIVMLKPSEGSLCEMNRMYVDAQARGHGIGRKLCNALISRALELGYTQMQLGALNRHVEALPLYQSLGFERLPDPPGYTAESGVIHMRKTLSPA